MVLIINLQMLNKFLMLVILQLQLSVAHEQHAKACIYDDRSDMI